MFDGKAGCLFHSRSIYVEGQFFNAAKRNSFYSYFSMFPCRDLLSWFLGKYQCVTGSSFIIYSRGGDFLVRFYGGRPFRGPFIGPRFGYFGAPFLGGLLGGVLGSAIVPGYGPYPYYYNRPYPYSYPYSYPYFPY